jgi:hypothetical protein
MDHLPERQRPWVQAIMRQASRSDVPTVRRLLQDLARRLDDEHPSAAESVREGLEETLTVMSLGLSERLQWSLTTTNTSGQPHSTRQAERQALARREDDAPPGRRGCARSRERLPRAENDSLFRLSAPTVPWATPASLAISR